MDELDVLAIGGEAIPEEEPPRTLVELINRALDRGVVVGGDVTISLAGVDLVYLGLRALLTSVSTARETLGRDVGIGRLGPGTGAAEGTAARSPSGPEPHGQGRTGSSPRAIDRREARGEPGEADKGPGGVEPSSSAAPQEDPMQAALAEVARTLPDRIDVDPEAVQRDLARLVLTIIELVRRVVEHQAIRRMDDPDLSDAQVERMGVALQRLDEKLAEIKGVFGLAEGDLDVDLGPLGKLF